MFYTVVGDWNVETTHPIDTEAEGYCYQCADAVDPTIAFAADWGSQAHQHSFTDANNVDHVIVVRKIVEE
jgi:hypothetical protein